MSKPSSRWQLSFVPLESSSSPPQPVAEQARKVDTGETQIQSGLTASQSFLVSFSGGGIPANASSLVTAAGGTIVARYNNVGAVLARSSSASFATKLRGTAGIEDVGNVAAMHSAIPDR